MIGHTNAAKNKLQQFSRDTRIDAKGPVQEQERSTFGIITEVDDETSQVKVRLLTADGKAGESIGEGFHPVINPLSEIHKMWGLLRKGLVVKIYWKNQLSPRIGMIEVVGDENHRILNKAPVANEIFIGPYKIMTGGNS